jgi:hypothetical protein
VDVEPGSVTVVPVAVDPAGGSALATVEVCNPTSKPNTNRLANTGRKMSLFLNTILSSQHNQMASAGR